jgi:type I restriction enzyme S subunit
MSKRRSAKFTFPDRYQPLPADWDPCRLRDLAKIVGGGTPSTDEPSYWDGDIPWLTPTEMNNITGRFATTSEKLVTHLAIDSSNCQLLPIGSIVITTRGTIGKAAIAGVPLTCNQSCEALLPKDRSNGDFLYYLLTFCQPIIERFGAGTTFMSVTRRDIRDIQFVVPKNSEQERISQILTKVDDVIDIARQEVEGAQRLKTALIQLLFTKGLPGRHRRFKQTKIGQIPEKWDVRTIRSVLAEPAFSGVSPESRADPPGTPILNVSCVKNGRCDPSALTYVDVDEATIKECEARKGDFFVLRGNGNREYVATGGVLEVGPPNNCIFSDKLIRLRFNAELVAEGFIPLMWQSYSFLRRLQSKAESGSGLWMMSKRDIRREFFACPKKDEQEEIVSTLRSAQIAIDACNSKANALERLKRSLLQNLLTGRIRLGASTAEVISSYPSRNGVAK